MFSCLIYIIFFNIIFQFNFNFLNYNFFIIYIALILKIGAAPFHFWFPNVIEGISWINNLILITWQKIAPILIISYSIFFNFFFFFIISSVLIGAIGGLNQISIRKLIAFSSINHIGWILSSLIFNEYLWLIYFCFYSIISFSLIYLFNTFKLFYINQIFSIFINSYLIKFIFIINFLSLGGIPPFLGFLPKWIIIQLLSNLNQNFIIFFIILITLITLYFYIRIRFSALLLNYDNIKWIQKIYYNNFSLIILSFFTFFSISGLFFSLSLISFF